MNIKDKTVAIIGLGYVGLPLAVEFGKKYNTIGFDVNSKRVAELKKNIDITLECSSEEIASAERLKFTDCESELSNASIYIVTVPTPVDRHHKPDLSPLIKASSMIGKVINRGDIVIYESTVYPGATEEDCIPEIETVSGLKYNVDFYAGYSPERINPGDKVNRLTTIKKITSGSTPLIAKVVDDLYSSIISAGTFKASSIKVAEAAKVIENTQRDVNIALMNEFAMMFSKMNLSTYDILEAAGTKWNFIKLQPGLVGGHCIGVDPYYLLQKANEFNFSPDMIRSAREINNGMAGFITEQIIHNMMFNSMIIPSSDILILGVTFKENCPDIRNSKVIDLYHSIRKYCKNVDIYDPTADACKVKEEYGVTIENKKPNKKYDVVALIVAHDQFINDENIASLLKDNGFIYDMKARLNHINIVNKVVL